MKTLLSVSTRVTVSVAAGIKSDRDLVPGTKLQRVYKGRNVAVEVLENGFSFEGERYKSLTAAVAAITGKHWNGFHFFHIANRGDK